MASDNGEQFYTRAHVDGLDGFEEYYQEQLNIADALASFQADHIQDSGWIDYDVLPTSNKNAMYASSGFKCGIRQIHYVYGNAATGQRYVTQKMIRVNIRNFANGQQVAQLPSGFVKEVQRLQMSGNGNRLPYTLEMLPDGKVTVFVHTSEQSNSASSNWIYAQFEWTE